MEAKLATYHKPEDAASPAPVEGYMVSFMTFYEWEFSMPPHRFLLSLLILRLYKKDGSVKHMLWMLSGRLILSSAILSSPCDDGVRGMWPTLDFNFPLPKRSYHSWIMLRNIETFRRRSWISEKS
jgi:hypothetical protein